VLLLLGCSAAPAAPSHAERVLPITKVLAMLHDMQKDLAEGLKQDEEAYDHLACWCETNKKQKEQSVMDAQRRIEDLEAQVERSAADKSSLQVVLKDMQADIAEDERSLKEATAMRKKEAAEFQEAEKDLIVGIQQIRGAITVLAKHHAEPKAMLQQGLDEASDSTAAAAAAAALRPLLPGLRKIVHEHASLLTSLSPEEKEVITSFMRAQPDIFEKDVAAFLQQRLPFRSYAPQSGQVFGILKQMEQDFEGNLSDSQKEETRKASAFAELRGSKLAQIAEQKQTVEAKTADLADAKVALVTAKKDLKDTNASLSEDMKFQLEMTKKCTQSDAEWERRRKLRVEEIKAVSEAVSILTSDEVRDAQSTTFSFMQLMEAKMLTQGERAVRRKAAQLLRGAVGDESQLRLLFAAIGKDPLSKVTAAIDELVAKLNIEQEDEVKHRDMCVGDLNENERDTSSKSHQQKTLEAKIADLSDQSGALAKNIEVLKAEISDLQVQLQRASLDRQAENHEFQRTIADQRLTRTVLEQAHSKLAAFYNKRHSLMQRATPADPVPKPWERAAPPGLREVNKNQKAGGVMSLIMDLIGEAKILEETAVSDEQNAQKAYAELVSVTNAGVKDKSRAVIDNAEQKAKVDGEKSVAEEEHAAVGDDLQLLASTLGDLHAQCDFILKNFDARQSARAAEIEALGQVKAVLSGANFSA